MTMRSLANMHQVTPLNLHKRNAEIPPLCKEA